MCHIPVLKKYLSDRYGILIGYFNPAMGSFTGHRLPPSPGQKYPSAQFGIITVDMGYILGPNWNLCIT